MQWNSILSVNNLNASGLQKIQPSPGRLLIGDHAVDLIETADFHKGDLVKLAAIAQQDGLFAAMNH